jgi:hypothetical protein
MNQEEIEEYIQSIPFDDPKEVLTKKGDLKLLFSTDTYPEFFDVWKKHKDELKKQGVSLTKWKGDWKIQLWMDYKSLKADKNFATPKDIKLKHESLLFPYQPEHVKRMICSLMNYGGAMDGSITGAGKTYTTLAVAKEMGLNPVVITSKSNIYEYKNVMKKHFKMKGFASNWEMMARGKKVKYYDKKNEKWNFKNPEKVLIIWDECHKAKKFKTLNAKMLVDAINSGIKNILASATVADNPLQMQATGYAIKLFETEKQFYSWAYKNGCYRNRFKQFCFDHEEETEKRYVMGIYNQIYSRRGSRITEEDMKDYFPDNRIIVEVCEDKFAEKIQKDYENKKGKVDFGNRMNLRQEIELAKVDVMIEKAKNLIADGNSVAVFLNFDSCILKASSALKTKCIIWGKNEKGEREKFRADFQKDRERIIILNTAAGGESISLHDKKGKYPRVSLISPSEDPMKLKQVLGRLPRSGAKSKVIQKIVFLKNTIDEKIAENLNRKIKNMNAVNEGVFKGIYDGTLSLLSKSDR